MGIDRPRGQGGKHSQPELLSIDRKVLQDSPIGVIELDAGRHIRYANREALAIMGLDSAEGMRLDLAFRKDNQRALLDRQWKERRKGLIGAYRAHLRRRSDGRKMYVHITGVPLFNPSGRYGGAVAFVQRAGDDELAEEIHRLNGSCADTCELLHDVMERLLESFDADMAVASRYSDDHAHAQSFFVLRRAGRKADRAEWRKRWIQLDEKQRASVENTKIRFVPDLSEYMQGEPWNSLLEDPLVKAILKEGQKGTLGRPIRRAKKLLGSITLLSRKVGMFDQRDVERIDELPLDTTFLEYVDYQDRQLAADRFELLQALTRCKTLRAACQLLTRRLVSIFRWSHVSAYQVHRSNIKLLAQHSVKRGMRVPKNQPPQPIAEGVLGRLVRTGERQNVGNVDQDPDYVRIIKGVSSELAWPITWGGDGKVRLIINVEDKHQNAFSENESAWLGVIAKEVGALMERIGETHFLKECFRGASDPMLYADENHVIRHANPAAAELLSCDNEAQVRGRLKALFEDPAAFEALIAGSGTEETQCRLRTRNSAVPAVSVHVSRQPLPDEFGGAVYVLRNLEDIQRAVELDLLGQATYEVAVQTKAPLSIAMATLAQCAEQHQGIEQQAAEKALRQLDRVERGYTRLAMFRKNPKPAPSSLSSVDLNSALRAVASDLQAAPDAPTPVRIGRGAEPPPVRGDHSQIAFVLETLLSGLVRTAPESEPVAADLAQKGNRVLLTLKGRAGEAAQGTDALRLGSDVRSSLWLARPMIDKFLKAHGATFDERQDGDRIAYTLSFPTAEAVSP